MISEHADESYVRKLSTPGSRILPRPFSNRSVRPHPPVGLSPKPFTFQTYIGPDWRLDPGPSDGIARGP